MTQQQYAYNLIPSLMNNISSESYIDEYENTIVGPTKRTSFYIRLLASIAINDEDLTFRSQRACTYGSMHNMHIDIHVTSRDEYLRLMYIVNKDDPYYGRQSYTAFVWKLPLQKLIAVNTIMNKLDELNLYDTIIDQYNSEPFYDLIKFYV